MDKIYASICVLDSAGIELIFCLVAGTVFWIQCENNVGNTDVLVVAK